MQQYPTPYLSPLIPTLLPMKPLICSIPPNDLTAPHPISRARSSSHPTLHLNFQTSFPQSKEPPLKLHLQPPTRHNPIFFIYSIQLSTSHRTSISTVSDLPLPSQHATQTSQHLKLHRQVSYLETFPATLDSLISKVIIVTRQHADISPAAATTTVRRSI